MPDLIQSRLWQDRKDWIPAGVYPDEKGAGMTLLIEDGIFWTDANGRSEVEK